MKCPHCKTTITTVIEWQTCSVGYERAVDRKLNDSIGEPQIIGGDYESISCPNCGETLADDFGDYGK